ncbi:MAG: hypothetical protein E7562_02635 [Ruminococcaceae bacterium]|nr:hypothetical protein [Oscillospiraceae bacterium]
MDENRVTHSEQHTIQPYDLLEQFIRRWYISVIILVAFLLGSIFYTKVICTPLYSSTAKIYVAKRLDEQITTSDLSVSTYLTRDYAELISDRTVLNAVIDRLDLDYSYGGLRGCVSINNPESTRILTVKVSTPDPKLSKDIAQTICEVSREKIVDLLNADYVNIISDAYMPSAPSSPNLRENIWYSFLAGFIVLLITMIIITFFDDKINGISDVEKHLGISVLGSIPYAKGRNGSVYGSRKRKPYTAKK